jgi:hypothetical protein
MMSLSGNRLPNTHTSPGLIQERRRRVSGLVVSIKKSPSRQYSANEWLWPKLEEMRYKTHQIIAITRIAHRVDGIGRGLRPSP